MVLVVRGAGRAAAAAWRCFRAPRGGCTVWAGRTWTWSWRYGGAAGDGQGGWAISINFTA